MQAVNSPWDNEGLSLIVICFSKRASSYLVATSTFPPAIEAPHLQIMSVNLTVYHPNISTHAFP